MRHSQDVVSGIVTILLAIGTLIALARIPQTSFQAIAPDLFPRLCAYGLILGGILLIIRGVVVGSGTVSLPSARTLGTILAGVVVFGALAPVAGYAPAGLLTLIISGLGSPDLKFRQLVVFSLSLILFSVFLFSYVLRLNMPILVLPGYRI